MTNNLKDLVSVTGWVGLTLGAPVVMGALMLPSHGQRLVTAAELHAGRHQVTVAVERIRRPLMLAVFGGRPCDPDGESAPLCPPPVVAAAADTEK